MVEVYRRHWLWALVGSPWRAAMVAVILVPIIVLVTPSWGDFRASFRDAFGDLLRGHGSALAWSAAALAALVLTPLVVNRVRDFRRRIEIDHGRREVRFVGFLRWDPWWRPRLGPFAVPFGGITHAERHSVLRRRVWTVEECPLRVIAGTAVIDVPPGMRGMRRLELTLRTLAARTPPPPPRHTELGLERLIVGGFWVFWAVGLALVALWFIPSIA